MVLFRITSPIRITDIDRSTIPGLDLPSSRIDIITPDTNMGAAINTGAINIDGNITDIVITAAIILTDAGIKNVAIAGNCIKTNWQASSFGA